MFGSISLPRVCPWHRGLAIILAGGQRANRPFLTSPDSQHFGHPACDFINNMAAWQASAHRHSHAGGTWTENPELNYRPLDSWMNSNTRLCLFFFFFPFLL